MAHPHTGKLFVLSAPSGAGKTTLKDRLLDRVEGIVYSVSATTRPKRAAEVDGVHYFFLSREDFEDRIARKQFVEYNEVHGNLYGTLKDQVRNNLDKGKSLIFDLDVYGKVNFDREFPEAVGILIEPPSLPVLRSRLEKRGTESGESLKLRMKNAEDELNFARSRGNYKYTVVNDEVDTALEELEKIVTTEMGH